MLHGFLQSMHCIASKNKKKTTKTPMVWCMLCNLNGLYIQTINFPWPVQSDKLPVQLISAPLHKHNITIYIENLHADAHSWLKNTGIEQAD